MIARLDAARKSLRESQNGELANRAPHSTGDRHSAQARNPAELGQIASELYVSPNTVKTHTSVAVSQTRGPVSLRGSHDRSPAPVDLAAESHPGEIGNG